MVDGDGDVWPNDRDNFPGTANRLQEDTAGDGTGELRDRHTGDATNTCNAGNAATCSLDDPLPLWGLYGPEPNGMEATFTLTVVAKVSAAPNKFGSLPTAPTKARTDLEPAPPDQKTNITDVVVIIDAFGGAPYPFAPPPDAPCP